ncbi:MAG: response regulator [Chloroflexi bacterium]|nr:response regulator [Chloroflexota bacterium]
MSDSRTILIVEDNIDNRTLLGDMLSALDYTVLEAVDGVEGVDIALANVPDLILMDLSLPNKDGWTATREIKAEKSTAHIPVIALTAHAMVGDRERALEAGCDDYMTKPINILELKKKIESYFSSKASST